MELFHSRFLAAAAKEKVEFSGWGIGFNYMIGVDAEIAMGISIFVELNGSMGGSVQQNKFKSSTAMAGFGVDNVYYPIDASTLMAKFGVKYHIGLASI